MWILLSFTCPVPDIYIISTSTSAFITSLYVNTSKTSCPNSLPSVFLSNNLAHLDVGFFTGAEWKWDVHLGAIHPLEVGKIPRQFKSISIWLYCFLRLSYSQRVSTYWVRALPLCSYSLQLLSTKLADSGAYISLHELRGHPLMIWGLAEVM